jgi:hypothetical protein
MVKLFDDVDAPAPQHKKPAAPGTAAALMENGNHRAAALGALRHGDRLNSWERDFAVSMSHAPRLTPRQAEKLLVVIGKASLPRPKPRRRPRRRVW